jgi:hypothetical protein
VELGMIIRSHDLIYRKDGSSTKKNIFSVELGMIFGGIKPNIYPRVNLLLWPTGLGTNISMLRGND